MNRMYVFLTFTLLLGLGDLARATVTGQWDFNGGNLSATTGSALSFRGDTSATTVFTTATIGGQTANARSQ